MLNGNTAKFYDKAYSTIGSVLGGERKPPSTRYKISAPIGPKKAVRKKITDDEIARSKLTVREDPRVLPRDPRPRGPRTRREYLAFRRWSGEGG